MKNSDVTKVKIRATVRWMADGTLGEVIKTDHNGFLVKWADDQIGIYTRGRILDLECLELVQQLDRR